MGTIGWHKDELYIPACMAGLTDEGAVIFCAYDLEPIGKSGKTILVRMQWARKIKPEWKELHDAICKEADKIRVMQSN